MKLIKNQCFERCLQETYVHQNNITRDVKGEYKYTFLIIPLRRSKIKLKIFIKSN
jgi:hypothetical protein